MLITFSWTCDLHWWYVSDITHVLLSQEKNNSHYGFLHAYLQVLAKNHRPAVLPPVSYLKQNLIWQITPCYWSLPLSWHIYHHCPVLRLVYRFSSLPVCSEAQTRTKGNKLIKKNKFQPFPTVWKLLQQYSWSGEGESTRHGGCRAQVLAVS